MPKSLNSGCCSSRAIIISVLAIYVAVVIAALVGIRFYLNINVGFSEGAPQTASIGQKTESPWLQWGLSCAMFVLYFIVWCFVQTLAKRRDQLCNDEFLLPGECWVSLRQVAGLFLALILVVLSCLTAMVWHTLGIVFQIMGSIPVWSFVFFLWSGKQGPIEKWKLLAPGYVCFTFNLLVSASCCALVSLHHDLDFTHASRKININSLAGAMWSQLGLWLAMSTTLIMLLWCYIRTCSTHTRVTDDMKKLLAYEGGCFEQVFGMETVLQTKKNGDRRHCKWCGTYKSDRMHHCRVCKACIPEMDNHTPGFYNCIGAHNYKYFLLTMLYTLILLTLCNYSLVCAIWLGSLTTVGWGMAVFVRFALVLGVFLELFSLMLFSLHVWMSVWYNCTTVEFCETEAFATFNLGLWGNLKHRLGPNVLLWLLPVGSSEEDEARGLIYATSSTVNVKGEMEMLVEAAPTIFDLFTDLLVIFNYRITKMYVFMSYSIGIFVFSGFVSFLIRSFYGITNCCPGLILSLTQTDVLVATVDAVRTGVPSQLVTWMVVVGALTEAFPQSQLATYSQLISGPVQAWYLQAIVILSTLWSFRCIAKALVRLDSVGQTPRSFLGTFAEVSFRITSLAFFGAWMRPEHASLHANVQIWLPLLICADYAVMLMVCCCVLGFTPPVVFWALVLLLASPPNVLSTFTTQMRIAYEMWHLLQLVLIMVASWRVAVQRDPESPLCYTWDWILEKHAYFYVLVIAFLVNGIYKVRAVISGACQNAGAPGYGFLDKTDALLALEKAANNGEVFYLSLHTQAVYANSASQLRETGDELVLFSDATGKDTVKFQGAFSALCVAAARCNLLCTQTLLASGADPNAFDPESKIHTEMQSVTSLYHGGQPSLTPISPLVMAVRRGTVNVVQALLAAGADPTLSIVYRGQLSSGVPTSLEDLILAKIKANDNDRKLEEQKVESAKKAMTTSGISDKFQHKLLAWRRSRIALGLEEAEQLRIVREALKAR